MPSKSEIVATVAESTGLPKATVGSVIDATLDAIVAGAEDDTVTFRGFGTFKRSLRRARTGRNPKTGEPVAIPEASALVFKCATSLKRT